MAIYNIILTFGTFCVHLVHFYRFGVVYQEKSGNPESNRCYLILSTSKLLSVKMSNFLNQNVIHP
jgi:hypothetical protein